MIMHFKAHVLYVREREWEAPDSFYDMFTTCGQDGENGGIEQNLNFIKQ